MSLWDAWAARPVGTAPAARSTLPEGPFDLIMADPPWRFRTWSETNQHKSAARHYALMTLDDIKALPVASIAAPDCVLILWTTNNMLDQALKVVEAWGFKFKTAAHWVKRTTNGKLAFGTGYVLRGAGEPILIGTRGKPKVTRSCRSVIEGPVRGHSRKPDEAFAWAEALMPEARRVELFSRENRPNWVTWGREAGKFDALSEP